MANEEIEVGASGNTFRLYKAIAKKHAAKAYLAALYAFDPLLNLLKV